MQSLPPDPNVAAPFSYLDSMLNLMGMTHIALMVAQMVQAFEGSVCLRLPFAHVS